MNFSKKFHSAIITAIIFLLWLTASANAALEFRQMSANEILMSPEMRGFYLISGSEQGVFLGTAENRVAASAYERINDFDTYYFKLRSNYYLLRTQPEALLAKNIGNMRLVSAASFYSYFQRSDYTYDKTYIDTPSVLENISKRRSITADFRPEIEILARYRHFFIGTKQLLALKYKNVSGYFAGDTDMMDKSLAQEYSGGVVKGGKVIALEYALSADYKEWSAKYFQQINSGYLFANSYLIKNSPDTEYKLYAAAKLLEFFNIYKNSILGIRLGGSGYETGGNLTFEFLPGIKRDKFYFFFIIAGNYRWGSGEARGGVSMPGFTAGYGNLVIKWDGAGTLFYKRSF